MKIAAQCEMAHGARQSVVGNNANGNCIYFGVREFRMTAISNGIALHGSFLPYDATFLVFSDYADNGVRMSALIPAHTIGVCINGSRPGPATGGRSGW